MRELRSRKARDIVTFKTGKLDSNAAVENGKYPFFTCAQTTYAIDHYAYNTECVLLAGNNAAGIFPLKYYKGKFNAYQRTYIIEPKDKNELDIKYFYYALRPYLKNFEQSATGATTKFLTLQILNSLEFSLPSFSEQQKIAAILSAYDDLIEINNKRIVLLEKAAEEIYREWFVRMRFPGWEQSEFEKGIPKGWEEIKLVNAFDFIGGGTPSTKENRYWEDGTINWFTPSDITAANGIFLPESGNKCTEEGFNNSSARMFPAYSIMMTSRATIGAIGINTTPACTNQGFITCIPNEEFPLTFLYHWLKLSKPYFELLATGATFAELTKGTFKKIKFLRPESHLVERFEELALPMFKKMEFLLQEVDLLKKSRDALLARLISGKMPVDELDIHFPPSMVAD